jgi:Icc-related predicted phosphoesterase
MRILAFSDTHGMHNRLIIPKDIDIDMVIFAGDYSGASTYLETCGFVGWFDSLKYKYKILVPGNHDYDIEYTDCTYTFINVERQLGSFNMFGSPYTPEFQHWNYMKKEDELFMMYDNAPSDIDILITHGPPFGILDNLEGLNLGSRALRDYVDRVQPKIHIFGHIHGGFGHKKINNTDFYNVSICNEAYNPINPLTIIEV